MIFMKILRSRIQVLRRKLLIIFDDMIAYILSNKKLNSIGTKFFIKGRKLSISLVFIP